MGDALTAPEGTQLSFDVHVSRSEGAKVILLDDGRPLPTGTSLLSSVDQTVHFSWSSDGKRHWFRADVVGPGGKLWMLGNPVYINWEMRSGRQQSRSGRSRTHD
jgi:hypothetical protein